MLGSFIRAIWHSNWWLDTLKRIDKIIGESAFDTKKKKAGLKFNPGLVLTCVRKTGPCTPKGQDKVTGPE